MFSGGKNTKRKKGKRVKMEKRRRKRTDKGKIEAERIQ
jgi:hypothetical protein